jgi:hypothetical protein
MAIQVIENYLSEERCNLYIEHFKDFLKKEPREHMFSAFGQPNSLAASKINKDNPLHRMTGNDHVDKSLIHASEMVNNVREKMEHCFGVELDLVNVTFSKMEPGAFNPLHSDSTKLDGSPWRDDGIPEELEYSALVYASSYGEDFFGGEIEFPKQDLVIKPERGMLIFFKGDVEHTHQINKVLSGERYTFILFFGKRGNVSGETFFTN